MPGLKCWRQRSLAPIVHCSRHSHAMPCHLVATYLVPDHVGHMSRHSRIGDILAEALSGPTPPGVQVPPGRQHPAGPPGVAGCPVSCLCAAQQCRGLVLRRGCRGGGCSAGHQRGSCAPAAAGQWAQRMGLGGGHAWPVSHEGSGEWRLRGGFICLEALVATIMHHSGTLFCEAGTEQDWCGSCPSSACFSVLLLFQIKHASLAEGHIFTT